MPVFVGFLRAVNVAGSGPLPMEKLRGIVSDLGFQDVRTVLASGNVVFRAPDRPPAALAQAIEGALERRLKLSTSVMLRRAEECEAILRSDPFPAAAKDDPGHLLVYVFREKAAPGAEAALRASIEGREQVRVLGREAFVVYPEGIGRSRVTLRFLEKHMGSPGTGRNWNTLRRLVATAGSS